MVETHSPRPIRILIADDHPAMRYGIAAMIEMQQDMVLVGEAANGSEAIELHRNLRPDITLMDLQMPLVSGLEAISSIREEARHARIIVLTTYAGDVQAARALKAGASAYLLKTAIRTEMIEVIRSVHGGRRHLPADIAQEIALHAGDEQLSDREIAVLELVASGNANKAIAYSLSISEETVKAHMRSIFGKLDVNDRTHAVTTAFKRGIIKL